LLSFAKDTYASRPTQQSAPGSKRTDDVTTALWFISVFYAVIAAVLGRRGVTDKLANVTMDLAFLALLIGVFVFVWAEHSAGVAISFTIAVGLALVAFVVVALATPKRVI
jgi:predicted branched-subunit amino acid permease